MLRNFSIALRYTVLLILMLSTNVARSQSRDEVFASIQKILNKAKGERLKSFTGEDKITQQVFTPATVSCSKQGLGKYGSEWVERYTNISWNDIFEHYIFSESSNDKLQLVQIKFKKSFTSEFFTSDKAGADDPRKYDKMELYARTKDKEELDGYLKMLYTFKEKKAESPYNAQIRNFTKSQAISWLKDKFKTQLEGDQYTSQIKIVSLDECRLVVTYSSIVRKYEAVIPMAIKSVTKHGSFEYETKIASVRTTTADMIDKGDWSYGIYSAIGIRTDDEEIMDNIAAAMKHLAGFCGNRSSYTYAVVADAVTAAPKNDGVRTQEPVRNTNTSTNTNSNTNTQVKAPAPEIVKDKDGNSYKTVLMGEYVWMTENLNTSRFRNGDQIREAKTAAEWKRAGELGQPAWCYYNNDPANGKKYGKLYNWFAVNDPRGLAPAGYHVPAYKEWESIRFVKPEDHLKATWYWDPPNKGATNISGFSALPGGHRDAAGTFTALNREGKWWSATIVDGKAKNVTMFHDETGLWNGSQDLGTGFSIRCAKD